MKPKAEREVITKEEETMSNGRKKERNQKKSLNNSRKITQMQDMFMYEYSTLTVWLNNVGEITCM